MRGESSNRDSESPSKEKNEATTSSPKERREKAGSNSKESGDTPPKNDTYGKFGRELRMRRNSCPLCNFVQNETEKGNPLPVEEWIYLAHLRNSHGIEP